MITKMAYVKRNVMPRLADIRCSRVVFAPGDRVLVRTYGELDAEHSKKIRKSIQKWAGCEVEVLIYDGTQMDIKVDRNQNGLVI